MTPTLANAAIIDVEIDDLNNLGVGIGRINGLIHFVPKTLPGDRIKAKITHQHAHYINAELIEIITPSAQRIKAACPFYNECGGCHYQHVNYTDQLTFKQSALEHTFVNQSIEHIKPCSQASGYRNRIMLHFGNNHEQTSLGFFGNSAASFCSINACLLVPDIINQVIKTFNELLAQCNLPIYNEKTHEGLLRALQIECFPSASLCTLTIITNGKAIDTITPWFTRWIPVIKKTLSAHNYQLHGWIQNINKFTDSRLFGIKERIIEGDAFTSFSFTSLEITKKYSSFIQTNFEMMEQLYTYICTIIPAKSIVIDVYSGLGILSMLLSRNCLVVYGIEVDEQSVILAKHIAKINLCENIEFIAASAEKGLSLLHARKTTADTIVVDPPRKGLDRSVIDSLLVMNPKQLIYVSCNPMTLKRDLTLLSTTYSIEKLVPFDMFPNTYHLECIAIMKRRIPEGETI